ncbi:hypothetical protein ACSBR2_003166 [Camellia fascicularis]
MEANEFELCKRHLLINFSVTEQEVVLGAMYVHIDFINSNPRFSHGVFAIDFHGATDKTKSRFAEKTGRTRFISG